MHLNIIHAAIIDNMLHHLSVLEHLQQEGEQQRLAEYLKGLTADIHAVAPLQYAAHPVVNAVLSSCLGEAQEEGIRVEAEAAVPEKMLSGGLGNVQ